MLFRSTAAGLWAVACLGLTIGAGFYTAALIGFVLIFIAIFYMPQLERKLTKKSGCYELHIELDQRSNLKELVKFIRNKGMTVISVEHNNAYANSGLSVYTIMLAIREQKMYRDHQLLIDEIKELGYVEFVEEIF